MMLKITDKRLLKMLAVVAERRKIAVRFLIPQILEAYCLDEPEFNIKDFIKGEISEKEKTCNLGKE